MKQAKDKQREGPSASKQLYLLEDAEEVASKASVVGAAFAPTIGEERAIVEQLERICDEIESATNTPVSRSESRALRKRLISDSPISVAARSETSASGSVIDRTRLSRVQIENELARIRESIDGGNGR